MDFDAISKNKIEKVPLYCCGALQYEAEDKYCPVEYSPKWREYTIRDFSSTSKSLMLFCPNCGIRLPSSLRDEWFDMLENQYGLEEPLHEDKDKVPEEFWIDKWWKERGLMNEGEPIIFMKKPIRSLF